MATRIVYTFWSRPGIAFTTEAERMLARLSVELANKHYAIAAGGGGVELVTDTVGAALLVGEMGLSFDDVSTDLDAISEDVPSQVWTAGLLTAQAAQAGRPGVAVHVDFDVLLWKPLPATFVAAPAFAEHVAALSRSALWQTYVAGTSNLRAAGVAVPPSWPLSLLNPPAQASGGGVAGGPLLAEAAQTALDALLDPATLAALQDATPDVRRWAALAFDRLTFATYVADEVGEMETLFQEWRLEDEALAAQLGYTRVSNADKHDPRIVARLLERAALPDAERLLPSTVGADVFGADPDTLRVALQQNVSAAVATRRRVEALAAQMEQATAVALRVPGRTFIVDAEYAGVTGGHMFGSAATALLTARTVIAEHGGRALIVLRHDVDGNPIPVPAPGALALAAEGIDVQTAVDGGTQADTASVVALKNLVAWALGQEPLDVPLLQAGDITLDLSRLPYDLYADPATRPPTAQLLYNAQGLNPRLVAPASADGDGPLVTLGDGVGGGGGPVSMQVLANYDGEGNVNGQIVPLGGDVTGWSVVLVDPTMGTFRLLPPAGHAGGIIPSLVRRQDDVFAFVTGEWVADEAWYNCALVSSPDFQPVGLSVPVFITIYTL